MHTEFSVVYTAVLLKMKEVLRESLFYIKSEILFLSGLKRVVNLCLKHNLLC
jgi:hypothetical protein